MERSQNDDFFKLTAAILDSGRHFGKQKMLQKYSHHSAGTATLFEARTGTLQLKDTKRHTNGEISCELCGYLYENSEHFLLHCIVLLYRKQERI